MTPDDLENLGKLKAELQSAPAGVFEKLVAALIGRLLGVSIAVASSGFQHGGDAGAGGRRGRSLRIECKRYADDTALKERELLGEIDHALKRDPALEAWILAATREAPEQLEDELRAKAEALGLPILVIDWKSPGPPLLAALCTVAPDIVEQLYTERAGSLARSLTNACADTLRSLAADLKEWALGYEAIRSLAARRVQDIWTNPRAARAIIRQNVAGGSAQLVRRESVAAGLTEWWTASGDLAVIVGAEGTGKTWATLDWLTDQLDDLPIALFLPASAAASVQPGGVQPIVRLLGEQLYEASGGIRDAAHWERRARRLLTRPADEGHAVLLVVDGLNQEPEADWEKIFATLQNDPFFGRVRVIGTVRPTYLDDRMKGLKMLVDRPRRIDVVPFDDHELDQRLTQAGLQRQQLSSELLQLARTPCLFDLVARFHAVPDNGEMTLHRLLWEYGRDAEGRRQNRSFSETDWLAWLSSLARRFRNGVTEVDRGELASLVHRADLSSAELKARLDDIIDGQLTEPGLSGRSRFKPEAVTHALGIALLDIAERIRQQGRGAISDKLDEWLDPISGLDQRAEILRAAVSIRVAQGQPPDDVILSVLLAAWLTTQNLAEAHRREVMGMAQTLRLALLDAVEQCAGYNQSGARLSAINALRAISRNHEATRTAIFERVTTWLAVISMDRRLPGAADGQDAKRAERIRARIGTSDEGEITIMGRRMRLVIGDDHEQLRTLVPSLLEGFPLAGAMDVFETAAIALAVRQRSPVWQGLTWLCILNEVDETATRDALRQRSETVRHKDVEPGVSERLPPRAGALLLRLTGHEADEERASEFDPGLDNWLTYEADYLARPAASVFPLERRHAVQALQDIQIPLLRRIERAQDFLLDPGFDLPTSFVAEVTEVATRFNITEVHSLMSQTIGDHNLEILLPALARCAPEALAGLMRRKLQEAPPASARYWRAYHAPEALLLVDTETRDAARSLREAAPADPDAPSELWARTCLLLFEIMGQTAIDQARIILGAGLKHLLLELMPALEPLSVEEAETLLSELGNDHTSEPAGIFMTLLVNAPIQKSEQIWRWLLNASDRPDHPHRGLLFWLLAEKDPVRFGAHLDRSGWTWSLEEENTYVSDYGSEALVAGASATPFDQLLPRIAPWRLIWAARQRGSDPTELQLAAEVLGRALLNVHALPEIPGAFLTVDQTRCRTGEYVVTRTEDEGDNPLERLSQALDIDGQRAANRRVADLAIARVREAQTKGASLYLSQIEVADMKALVEKAPDAIDAWLEGLDAGSPAFCARIAIAEGLYLALCEALLEAEPARGGQLWRLLGRALRTRYLGAGQVEVRLHIPFRVPNSETVGEIRRMLVDLQQASSDQNLADVAFAASAAGRTDWIERIASEDAGAPEPWRRLRSERMRGFLVGDGSVEPDAWPVGRLKTSSQSLRQKAARTRARDNFARHWWRAFLRAEDQAEAYAAWIMFVQAADRRAYLWMAEEREALGSDFPLRRLKETHFKVNENRLKQSMEKRDEKLAKSFLDRETTNGLGPWGKAPFEV